MRDFLNVDEIIETALLMIANHELFVNPIVRAPDGTPIRINNLRTFDGLDFNQRGLTLSIFPYSYQGTSNETTTSTNAAMNFKPYNVGSGQEGFDQCTLNFVVNLKVFGAHKTKEENQHFAGVSVERNLEERALYRWLPVLRAILLTKPIENLGGLVLNSTVNWCSYRTPKWEGNQGKNLVMHESSLLWTIDANFPRNWKMFANRSALPVVGGLNSTWLPVGLRVHDSTPIYWDTEAKTLVTLTGYPLVTTPGGVGVVYNPDLTRLEKLDGTALTLAENVEPRMTPPGKWIDTDFLIRGVLMPDRTYVYWHKVNAILQLADGTPVTALEDGTQLGYDPASGAILDLSTTEAVVNPLILPLHASRFDIFGANGLKLVDSTWL